MIESLSTAIDSWFIRNLKLDDTVAFALSMLVMVLIALLITYVVWRIFYWFLHKTIPKLTSSTKTIWDDTLLSKGVLNAIALLLPALLLDYFAPYTFAHLTEVIPLIKGATSIFVIFTLAYIVASLMKAINDILSANPDFRDKPIGSFTQLGKILSYTVALILAISIIFDKSPIYLLSGIGAIAAVVLLVFKDSILGFVASIQLSANNMVHVGDWVTVPKYNADGDVMEINLTTIKVQNFDKTITTIPTYAFVTDSFTNWRGMEQSAGRRIKRAVHIQISSIKFCTPEMLERFKRFQLVKDYIETRQKEIDAYNKNNDVDTAIFINGRKLTNIGIFQVYLESYLEEVPAINSEMTAMVRQLAATPNGVPIEIYAFSKVKEWKLYEKVMADLFDHIMASASAFDLVIFENPSGTDVQSIGG